MLTIFAIIWLCIWALTIVRPPTASDIDAGAASRDAPGERMHDRHPV